MQEHKIKSYKHTNDNPNRDYDYDQELEMNLLQRAEVNFLCIKKCPDYLNYNNKKYKRWTNEKMNK